MVNQNSSGFKVPFIASTTAPSSASENIGLMWYETDTQEIKIVKSEGIVTL